MYAVLDTNYGKIKMRLYHRRIPKLVAHFFGLAEGTLASINPKSGKKEKKRFYDGLTFHRVIPNFIIQGGDPLANSKGGPGYNMPEEYHPSLKHDRPGVVSLANSGPNTTGSQFFITLKPNPKLDHDHPTNAGSGRGYSIIGQVVKGMGVVKKISTVKRDTFDKPLKPVIIKTIKIERIYK